MSRDKHEARLKKEGKPKQVLLAEFTMNFTKLLLN